MSVAQPLPIGSVSFFKKGNFRPSLRQDYLYIISANVGVQVLHMSVSIRYTRICTWSIQNLQWVVEHPICQAAETGGIAAPKIVERPQTNSLPLAKLRAKLQSYETSTEAYASVASCKLQPSNLLEVSCSLHFAPWNQKMNGATKGHRGWSIIWRIDRAKELVKTSKSWSVSKIFL